MLKCTLLAIENPPYLLERARARFPWRGKNSGAEFHSVRSCNGPPLLSASERTSGRRRRNQAREHASLGAEQRMQPGVTLQAAGQQEDTGRPDSLSFLWVGGSEDKEDIDCCPQQRNLSEVEVGRSGCVFCQSKLSKLPYKYLEICIRHRNCVKIVHHVRK